MKRLLLLSTCAMALSLALSGLTGCGGSSNPVTVPPVATITSFTASPATITAGQGTTLTGVFINGTGVITPGNLAAATGTPVPVTPTTTTTYTLTVTPSGGTAVTQTVVVTVNPAPVAPTVTVTPASSSITKAMALTVPIVVSGPSGDPTPTGTVTLTSGTYTSAVVTLSSGGGMINVPAGSLATGTDTLTATYAPDTASSSIYNGATGTASVTVTPAPPVISSFVASLSVITAGASSTLTGTFTGGTGVITPGNLSVTSGTPVTVSPAATTTYTLTVTPTTGSPVTSTATITVVPAASITSFVASPTSINPGTSATLTGIFAGGTGVVTPGNLSVTSGTPVTVSPSATTTYTLTVTNSAGTTVTATAMVTVQSTVTVNPSIKGPAVTDQLLGMNLASWYDVVGNDTAVNSAFGQAGIKAIRWPGGSWSDEYHWKTPNSSSNPNLPFMCENNSSGVPDGNTTWGGYNTFAQFVTGIVQGGSYDLALTADYGTDTACTGPGDPTEAASWAADALTTGITVSHMTVGNEEYGSWETDLHSSPHNGATYASTVVGTSGYYSLIKAASPGTLVGVDVEPNYAPWDQDVMGGAKGSYDFVEYHYYPETPGQESDTFLVQRAAKNLTTNINTIRSELTNWGTPNTPIYVGEIGGPYSNPGKQSWSIAQGLYAGQVLGEMMNAGVSRLTWWIGFGNCNGQSGNLSTSLYGWQDFGAYNVFSDGAGDPTCPGAGPIGTMSPTARAFQLFSNLAVNGQNALTATVTGDTTEIRAYAATNPAGTALMLFNVNETSPQQVSLTLTGKSTTAGVTVITYDKALYDLSGSPTGTPPDPAGTSTWAPPTTTTMGAQSLPLTLTLPPWSMNVVIIQ